MLRAFIGASFAVLPAFADRFGGAALPLACVALGAFAAISAYVILRSEAEETWSIAAADAVALVVVVPLLAVASDVLVADAFLGGGTDRFLAAALAVACATCVVAALGAFLGTPTIAPLAFLATVLAIASGFVGAQRFSADGFADGMSLGWMVAAMMTLGSGLVSARVRPFIPLGTAACYLILMVAVSRSGDFVTIPDAGVLVGLLAAALGAGALVFLPGLSARLTNARR